VIDIFDSAGGSTHLSLNFIKAIAKFFSSKGNMLTFQFVSCDEQINGNDCGVHAIANLISMVNGIDPSEIMYKQTLMRKHLEECLECRVLSVFPNSPVDRSLRLKESHVEQLYCSCHMPDEGFYFSCKICKAWFHPICQGLGHMDDLAIKKAKNLKCIKCQSKGRKRK
jgi:hypothetical protein